MAVEVTPFAPFSPTNPLAVPPLPTVMVYVVPPFTLIEVNLEYPPPPPPPAFPFQDPPFPPHPPPPHASTDIEVTPAGQVQVPEAVYVEVVCADNHPPKKSIINRLKKATRDWVLFCFPFTVAKKERGCEFFVNLRESVFLEK
ncbi:hypothetical protein E0I26_04260 [Flavobacterium rhamnosiphilum]|uniref:Uncharacterized protein n=1 Tax=Flavobacterium rhamnosiphilum TaxID=2541724 RepID=A0A4R5FBS0_9FLAO|nr:hypothetical protein [Flavobacterium rhamnosiphilum]TDE45907.1 hypothetical protein E0I26_04260 [Flavobacterium rhamnosiphilum]